MLEFPLAFLIFAGIALAFSIAMLTVKSPVSAALCLVTVLLCFAGIYGTLGAHLLAGFQVLVYTGAVMVLFVFVIMLLNVDENSSALSEITTLKLVSALFVAFIGVFGFGFVFKSQIWNEPKGLFSSEAIENSGGNTRVISEVLFSDHLLPFELTSLLLLAAIVGVVAIAMRKKT
jgi:NADH-quinone oxidoreductase subunit J